MALGTGRSSLVTQRVYKQATACHCYWLAEHIGEQLRMGSASKNRSRGSGCSCQRTETKTLRMTYWLQLTRTTGQFGYLHTKIRGQDFQAKQSESLRAQDPAIRKPDQKKNKVSHSSYNHPYALNHIQRLKWTFDNYEVNNLKVSTLRPHHRFHAEKWIGRKQVVPRTHLHGHTKEPYFRWITLHRQSITQSEHPTMAT